MNDEQVINSRIKERRKAQKLTQVELSEKIGVSKTAVSDWERNLYVPERSSLVKIAQGLNTSISYLLGEVDDPRPTISGSEFFKVLFGERIKERRNAKGLAQEALAELVDVEVVIVDKLEQGMINPAFELCKKLADALGTPMTYLLGQTDDPGGYISHEVIRETFIEKPDIPDGYGDTETPRNERGANVEIEPGSIVYEYYKGFSDEKIKLTFPPSMSPERMEEIVLRLSRATPGASPPEQDFEPQKEKTSGQKSPVAVVI